jgi:hypothetical protein
VNSAGDEGRHQRARELLDRFENLFEPLQTIAFVCVRPCGSACPVKSVFAFI